MINAEKKTFTISSIFGSKISYCNHTLHCICLLAISEVRCKPTKCSTSDPNASQAVQEQCVGNSVECCAEVEEDENCKSVISCTEEVVGDFDKGCFSAVFWTETGLESFMEVVVTRWDCSCAATIISSVLEMKRRLEMGR